MIKNINKVTALFKVHFYPILNTVITMYTVG